MNKKLEKKKEKRKKKKEKRKKKKFPIYRTSSTPVRTFDCLRRTQNKTRKLTQKKRAANGYVPYVRQVANNGFMLYVILD